MIEKAIIVAIGEWNSIRRSLEKCGDIGELASEEVVIDDPYSYAYKKNLTFHLKLIEMGKRLLKCVYSIPEAADVFTVLDAEAEVRLGLTR